DAGTFFEFVDSAQEFRQMVQRDDFPFRLAIRFGGSAHPFFALGDIMHHTGLRGNRRAVAEFQMSGYARLTGEDDVITKFRAAGNSYLRDHQTMVADNDVMTYLHEVIDFRAFADDRWA